jgi:hypothetical protein
MEILQVVVYQLKYWRINIKNKEENDMTDIVHMRNDVIESITQGIQVHFEYKADGGIVTNRTVTPDNEPEDSEIQSVEEVE